VPNKAHRRARVQALLKPFQASFCTIEPSLGVCRAASRRENPQRLRGVGAGGRRPIPRSLPPLFPSSCSPLCSTPLFAGSGHRANWSSEAGNPRPLGRALSHSQRSGKIADVTAKFATARNCQLRGWSRKESKLKNMLRSFRRASAHSSPRTIERTAESVVGRELADTLRVRCEVAKTC